jgi:hypothetical protein
MTIVATPGAADADSYVTYVEYTAYCEARGITVSDEADAEIELRKGTASLDNLYRGLWKGYRTEQAQALAWPRIGDGGDSRFRYPGRETFFVYGIIDADGFEIPTDEVPTQVKNATFEAALLVKAGVTLEPRLERGGQIKSIGKGVGPLRKDITYMDGAPSVDRVTVIEGLLRGLVKGQPGQNSGGFRILRA